MLNQFIGVQQKRARGHASSEEDTYNIVILTISTGNSSHFYKSRRMLMKCGKLSRRVKKSTLISHLLNTTSVLVVKVISYIFLPLGYTHNVDRQLINLLEMY